MNNMKLPYGYQADIKAIKAAGFTHFKIELEAHLGREYTERPSCPNCDGDGTFRCETCHGNGYTDTDEASRLGSIMSAWSWRNIGSQAIYDTARDARLALRCADCVEGYNRCDDCDGEGYTNDHSDWSDEEDCQEFILGRLPRETRAKLNYIEFYNDGSVDSEITATLPIEEAWRGIELIEAMNSLGREVGKGLETDSAGLHLTLLTSSTYPTYKPLDADKITNFSKQMTKLMPALFAGATHNGYTRGLYYRRPGVSPDKSGVYPAICTHDDTCLEYRVFDPCYDQPEALLEKIQVIARTIEYYSDKQVNLKARKFHLSLPSSSGEIGQLRTSLDSLSQLQALDETIKYLKPRGTSLKAFKLARQLDVQASELRAKLAKAKRDLRLEYKAYLLDFRAAELREFARWYRRGNATTTAERVAMAKFRAGRTDKPVSLSDYADNYSNNNRYYGTELRLT